MEARLRLGQPPLANRRHLDGRRGRCRLAADVLGVQPLTREPSVTRCATGVGVSTPQQTSPTPHSSEGASGTFHLPRQPGAPTTFIDSPN